ncbi:MAG: formate--tetrahydrofolate ligase [Sphingobacteriia bacterium]|nr:formate--tetrahydrofolate ligase [Sphingobacteriia bacterium]
MKTDLEIAREIPLTPILQLSTTLGIPESSCRPYGHFIGKIELSNLNTEKVKKNKLVLVTAISPTKAGNGKTVTTVSLSLGLNRLGKNSIVALREPSLGPVFGMKGGAAGGGYAQVLPMEDINLHFTGDFHAITSAHNTLTALIENYQYHHLNTDKALKEITWKRILDVNDRSLRNIMSGLGGLQNGVPRESGFDITPASELMAILCLAQNADDLRTRIDRIVIGYTLQKQPFTVKDLGAGGALCILLKDALLPNLVQTTENTPALIHGGPFANIAHGCNSVIATQMALSLGEYVITEAGFGSDLGAEKFIHIKCRTSGLIPSAAVIVVTLKALKVQGGLTENESVEINPEAVKNGIPHLHRHILNLQQMGMPIIISLNYFANDSELEINNLSDWCIKNKYPFAINKAFTQGGKGAEELAQKVLDAINQNPSPKINYLYELEDSIENKLNSIVQKIYHGARVELSPTAISTLKKINKMGWNNLPVCIAKTPYSFTENPSITGTPEGFILPIRELIPQIGAGFIVAIAGDILRMPGLPVQPAALSMDIQNGIISGLS